MKHNGTNPFHIRLGLIFFILVFTQCKKEMPEPQFTIDAGLAIPLGYASLTLENILPDSSENILVNNDGGIEFYFREDSLLSYNVDDLFEFPSQPSESETFKLGIIELDNFGPITANASLNDLLLAVDTTTASLLVALDGTNAQMPGLQSQSATEFSFSDFDQFQYVTFSEGGLALSVHNTLPVSFVSAIIDLYTIAPDSTQYFVGSFSYSDVGAGQSQLDSIDMAGQTIYNSFSASIVSYETAASTGAVFIDLNQGLNLSLESYQLKVVAGKAKIPAQQLSGLSDTSNISFEAAERLAFLRFTQAKLHYEMISSLDIPIDFSLELPTATNNGNPVIFNFSSYLQGDGNLDLSQVLFDLTQNPDANQPYNYLPVSFNLNLQTMNNWVEFDSASSISFTYGIQDIQFDFVQGWLGVKQIDLPSDTIDLGFEELDKLGGTIYLDNPTINILVDNNILLPVSFDLNMQSTNNQGNIVGLGIDPLYLPVPQNPGDEVHEPMMISNSNSNLSDFLSNIPQTLSIGGNIVTNPDSATNGIDYTNYVSSSGAVNLGVEMQLPFKLSLDHLTFSDTMDVSVSAEDVKDALGGKLSIVSINGIPLEVDVDLYFIDTISNQVIESIPVNLMDPALVDANGNVSQSTEKTTSIVLTEDQIKNLPNAQKLAFTATANTTNSQNQTVQFYSDYSIDIKVGVLINYSVEL